MNDVAAVPTDGRSAFRREAFRRLMDHFNLLIIRIRSEPDQDSLAVRVFDEFLHYHHDTSRLIVLGPPLAPAAAELAGARGLADGIEQLPSAGSDERHA